MINFTKIWEALEITHFLLEKIKESQFVDQIFSENAYITHDSCWQDLILFLHARS